MSPDTALDGVNAGIWSGIEINVALACASLPAIKPLIAKAVPRLLSSHTRSGHRNRSGYDSHPLSDMVQSKNNRSKVQRSVGRSALGDEEMEAEAGIVVERTVHMHRHEAPARSSREGSERSLVNWKADIYAEERAAEKQDV